jgi:hypothetical protein
MQFRAAEMFRSVIRVLPFHLIICAMVSMAFVFGRSVRAADNELTPEETAEGWQLLFDGRDLRGWSNNNKEPVRATIDVGAVNPHGSGGYLLVYDQPFGDFVLKCDVKMSQPACNSGIFVRTGDLNDPVYSGLEVQVSSSTKPGRNNFAALYDLVAPTKDATHGPGQWNTIEIRCEGPIVEVSVNGEKVASINCDEWDQPGKRPDGSTHKFGKAIRDFPREGYIGLQDHGHDVWFKNIKLKKL